MSIVWLGVVLVALPATGKVIRTKPGVSATLDCEVSTSSNTLSWYHGNDMIVNINGRTGFIRKGSASVTQRSKVKQERFLEISQVRKEDAGKFVCDANGNSQEFTLLVVSVWASSSELQVGSEVKLQCEVGGLSSDSTVKWIAPNGNQHAGTVHLNRVSLEDEGTWVCTFSYDKETFRENLYVKIKGPTTNTPIFSPTQSSKVNLKKPCPGCGTQPPSGVGHFDWWVWVAVGVGAFFVVLLMVCVVVLCRRIKRRKKKLQKMRAGRQSLRPRKYCQCNCPTAAAKPQPGRQRGRPPALAMKPLLME